MKGHKVCVMIYVKQHCPFCKKVKDLLDEKDIKYEEIDVLSNSSLFDFIKSKYNVRTVPQIFITDENGNCIHHISGCDKFMALEKEGKLYDMLNNNSEHSHFDKMSYNDDINECEEYSSTSILDCDDLI